MEVACVCTPIRKVARRRSIHQAQSWQARPETPACATDAIHTAARETFMAEFAESVKRFVVHFGEKVVIELVTTDPVALAMFDKGSVRHTTSASVHGAVAVTTACELTHPCLMICFAQESVAEINDILQRAAHIIGECFVVIILAHPTNTNVMEQTPRAVHGISVHPWVATVPTTVENQSVSVVLMRFPASAHGVCISNAVRKLDARFKPGWRSTSMLRLL